VGTLSYLLDRILSYHSYRRITELASRLTGIGINLDDEDITDVMIFNLDSSYSSIASTLMASKEELKVSDVASTLFEEEQRKGGPPDRGSRSVALTGRDSRACFRCGRRRHRMADCNARRDVDGRTITPHMEEEARKYIKSFQRHPDSSNPSRISDLTANLNDVAY
jgi:hypothetical protein